ncbi:uncharacterized protein LOC128229169 [Mya arenaria]|uniref:uncharacterized protein LOC128229169 n=1 Tax=Mya arenaria TaxID=6604 RepID=UPI0022E11B80|nr:uncharacterized protein LOC128229169 [Mya arenaria]
MAKNNINKNNNIDLAVCLQENNFGDAEYLLDGGADPNKISQFVGASPMHLAAGLGLKTLSLLLQYGGDPNVSLEDGTTPLHVAAMWGFTECVSMLLANGGDPFLKDQEGLSASELAYSYGHEETAQTIEYYVKQIIDTDEPTITPKYSIKRLSVESAKSDNSEEESSPSLYDTQELQDYLRDFTHRRNSSVYKRHLQRQVDQYFGVGQGTHLMDVTSPDHPYIERKSIPEMTEEPSSTDSSLKLHLSASDNEPSTDCDSFVTCDGEDVETVLQKTEDISLNKSFDESDDESYDDYSSHCPNTVIKNPTYDSQNTTPRNTDRSVQERRSDGADRSKKYCRRELLQVPDSQDLLTDGDKCEYCSAVATHRSHEGSLCDTCYKLAQELDQLMCSGDCGDLPDLMTSVFNHESTISNSEAGLSRKQGEKTPAYRFAEKVSERDKNKSDRNCARQSSQSGKLRRVFEEDEWNVDKYEWKQKQESAQNHGESAQNQGQSYYISAGRSVSQDCLPDHSQGSSTKNNHHLSPKKSSYSSRFLNDNHKPERIPKTQENKAVPKMKNSTLINTNGRRSEIQTSKDSVNDLYSKMNRLSIDLQSGDGMFGQSTLTHVTELDDFSDSILTNDESFFDRNIDSRNMQISKKEFHASDISSLSEDTVGGENGKISRLRPSEDVVQSRFHPSDISSLSTETAKSSDTLSIKDLGFLDDYSPTANLNDREFLTEVDMNDNDRRSKKAVGNNQKLSPNMDELWSQVRACKHAKQQVKDKNNVLDIAFYGRESASTACGSVNSNASTVDYIYTDKENGITLIERHLPSLCGSQGSRKSLDSVASGMTVGSDARLPGHVPTSARGSFDSQATEVYSWRDNAMIILSDDSCAASQESDEQPISQELLSLDNEAVRSRLCSHGDDPGPVTITTRQQYLRRLSQIEKDPDKKVLTKRKPEYSAELRQALSGLQDMTGLRDLEERTFTAFQNPDPARRWREGTLKSSFNYLLLDPRITQNLPNRACNMDELDVFRTFISATVYIGKGKRARPYSHLYEAIKQQKKQTNKVNEKVTRILDIWGSGQGVVSLHCYQSVIPVEAYTREAAMVDAIGLDHLTNKKRGDYYGVSATYSMKMRRTLGVYLLKKALQIFLAEGERQISPVDILKPIT